MIVFQPGQTQAGYKPEQQQQPVFIPPVNPTFSNPWESQQYQRPEFRPPPPVDYRNAPGTLKPQPAVPSWNVANTANPLINAGSNTPRPQNRQAAYQANSQAAQMPVNNWLSSVLAKISAAKPLSELTPPGWQPPNSTGWGGAPAPSTYPQNQFPAYYGRNQPWGQQMQANLETKADRMMNGYATPNTKAPVEMTLNDWIKLLTPQGPPQTLASLPTQPTKAAYSGYYRPWYGYGGGGWGGGGGSNRWFMDLLKWGI